MLAPITVQQKPNRWSCVLTSFAMALDLPQDTLIAELGHDGSRILFPNLPEPACRHGFHVQELIRIALRHGFAVTPIELFPVLESADGRQTQTILYPANNWRCFAAIIRTSRGVIDGQSIASHCGHMVAYDHGRIYDPDGPVYEYSRLACEGHLFFTRCAWRIDTIGDKQL